MELLSRIYDAGIYIYALSLLFFFSDCIRRNLRAKWMGTGFLVFVFIFQLIFIGIRIWKERIIPIFTLYDFLFMFSFILVIASLLMCLFKKSEFAVLLLSVIGFSVLVLNHLWFDFSNDPMSGWQGVHGLLVFHIILANLSVVSFTVAAVFAGMYLFLHKKLKDKKWNDTVRRLPSLESMDKYSYFAIVLGMPLLCVSLIVAILSILSEGRLELFLDSKVVTTVVGLCIYIVYFVKRRSKQNSGVIISRWALIGYVVIIINLLLNSWSKFHWWTGA
ncbi:cytochrome c biogenesis protein CcsA [Paenibacillus crassostreae]|uniref:ABC transporter permease n=1 Tax=Paenibacillus crassostreae TaxID=1763538 RepID=A0A167EE17_9BACL|nr:cytochrome c biogenesis protein CcsA [Paenibacillus crassostreae]AOZ91928.1 ABC transporter permease [Paenibacillus crassostreae]OAB75441.1 ABC transporter permease [Paenibacillus crassostreae]